MSQTVLTAEYTKEEKEENVCPLTGKIHFLIIAAQTGSLRVHYLKVKPSSP